MLRQRNIFSRNGFNQTRETFIDYYTENAQGSCRTVDSRTGTIAKPISIIRNKTGYYKRILCS